MFSGSSFSEVAYSSLPRTTFLQSLTASVTAAIIVIKDRIVNLTINVASAVASPIFIGKIIPVVILSAVEIQRFINTTITWSVAVTTSAAKLLPKFFTLTSTVVASTSVQVGKVLATAVSSTATYSVYIYKTIYYEAFASYIAIEHSASHYITLVVLAISNSSIGRAVNITKLVSVLATLKIVRLIVSLKSAVVYTAANLQKSVKKLVDLVPVIVVAQTSRSVGIIKTIVVVPVVYIKRSVDKIISVVVNSTVHITRLVDKTISIIITASIDTIKFISKSFEILVTTFAAVNTLFGHLLAVTVNATTSLVRQIQPIFHVTVQGIITVFAQLAKITSVDYRYVAYIGQRFYTAYASVKDFIKGIL